MRTRAGKSTGSPSRFAGLNLICCAARTADSSSPCPRPLTTRLIWIDPLARKTRSMTTSPSIFKLRPSAVYSGRGLSVMLGVLSTGPVAAAFFLVASALVSTAPKPPATTVPFGLPPDGGVAVPVPKPVLATLPGNAVRIAEAARLYLVGRSLDRRGSRAARIHVVEFHIVFRALRTLLIVLHLGGFEGRVHFRKLFSLFNFGLDHLGSDKVRENVRLLRVELYRFGIGCLHFHLGEFWRLWRWRRGRRWSHGNFGYRLRDSREVVIFDRGLHCVRV